MHTCCKRLSNIWFLNRTLNFFAGSESCDVEKRTKFSTLQRGILTITCPSGNPSYVLNSPLAMEAKVNQEEITARSLSFIRNNEKFLEDGSQTLHYNGTRYQYTQPVSIAEEYVSAYCHGEENFHMQVPLKETRLKEAEAKLNNRTFLNVLLLNIDALSRNHFFRRWGCDIQFPIFLAFLTATAIFSCQTSGERQISWGWLNYT